MHDEPAEPSPIEPNPEEPNAADPGPPRILGEHPVPPARPARPARQEEGSVKETIISMLISLAMALVAKVYVVEAFMIPTGSMAPTLLGQHMQFRSPETGYHWTVNPWFMDGDQPRVVQSRGTTTPVVTDPMTVSSIDPRGDDFDASLRSKRGFTPTPVEKPLLAGDRILVQKYIYEIFPPQRYDVVVFKNPEDATINFIKRLVGLPNEQIWLADGDVFARKITRDGSGSASYGSWQIERKPADIQETLWRPIFSSEYTPLNPTSPSSGRRWFRGPWVGDKWETLDTSVYRTETPDPTTLRWNVSDWPITDWEPYNDVRVNEGYVKPEIFPVSDLRMRAMVLPDSDGLVLTARISARGHDFMAEIGGGRAVVRMRNTGLPWQEIGAAPFAGFDAGESREIEFWHVDQAMELRIDGRAVVRGEYDWDPSTRLLHSTGRLGDDYGRRDSLGRPSLYEQGRVLRVEWGFEGAPVTLRRVGLDRDIYYQPREGALGDHALATHPDTLVELESDEYFMLGDNSPSSKDGRLWDKLDQDIRTQIQTDEQLGVVNRKLLLGKAFFVYFPAPHRTVRIGNFNLPVPDFGSMRFIR